MSKPLSNNHLEEKIKNILLSFRYYSSIEDSYELLQKIRKAKWPVIFLGVLLFCLVIQRYLLDNLIGTALKDTFGLDFLEPLFYFSFVLLIVFGGRLSILVSNYDDTQSALSSNIEYLDSSINKFHEEDAFKDAIKQLVKDIDEKGLRNYHLNILNSATPLYMKWRRTESLAHKNKQVVVEIIHKYS